MLVVLVDDESIGDPDDMKKLQAAKELYGEDVIIVPVAIGDEADPSELEKITAHKDNLIEESKDISPEELAKKIMEKSFGGRLSIAIQSFKHWFYFTSNHPIITHLNFSPELSLSLRLTLGDSFAESLPLFEEC